MKGNGTISTNAILGFVFLINGFALAVSAGFAVGMPFIMMGVVFLILSLSLPRVEKSQDADESRG